MHVGDIVVWAWAHTVTLDHHISLDSLTRFKIVEVMGDMVRIQSLNSGQTFRERIDNVLPAPQEA